MESLKFSQVSFFVVTLEVAIAVISLIPLTAAFLFMAFIAWKHEGPDTFYPEDMGPLLTAAGTVFIAIYILQAIQLLAGVFLLKSFSLIEVNLWGTIKFSWCWLMSSAFTLIALCYLIYRTVTEFESNAFILACLLTFSMQKTISFTFVGRFTIGACIAFMNEHKD